MSDSQRTLIVYSLTHHRDIVRTTILAFCTSASLLRMVPDRSDLLRYMGSALGYFARLPMAAGIPFEKFNRIMAEAFRLSSDLGEGRGEAT